MDVNKLIDSNPWWLTKKVLEELMGIRREAYELLIKSVTIKEVTIITGVRRSGKSTIMYQMIDALLKNGVAPEQILFINLEDNRLANDSLDEIYSAYKERINPGKKAYVFLDEIQRKEKWELWIRRHYDLKSDCKFIISGSCSYLLKKEYSTLLTGRNLTFDVFPLSFQEFLSFKNIALDLNSLKKGLILEKEKHMVVNAFGDYLYYGGFPDITLKEKEFKTKVLAQYFDDLLYKDIVDRHNLNSQKTKDLALYLITNFTGVLSLRTLRAVLGLSYESISDYMSYYKEAFLFFSAEHFAYSMKEQKTNPSKIYCIDNGLRNAVSFKFSKDEGKLAENLVFIELKRREQDAYYWKGKQEVDFIIKYSNQSIEAINVSYSDEIPEREISGLFEFKELFKKTKKLTIITKDTEKTEHGITYIPLWKWMLLE
ncbi:MAG: ATP-binding protein [Nanoarchaeota archaeon]